MLNNDSSYEHMTFGVAEVGTIFSCFVIGDMFLTRDGRCLMDAGDYFFLKIRDWKRDNVIALHGGGLLIGSLPPYMHIKALFIPSRPIVDSNQSYRYNGRYVNVGAGNYVDVNYVGRVVPDVEANIGVAPNNLQRGHPPVWHLDNNYQILNPFGQEERDDEQGFNHVQG
jgi:hypothetical protein